jgi:chromate transporter
MTERSSPPISHRQGTAEASLLDIARVNATIGLFSFGGGLTSWFARELVERRGWLTYRQFLSALAVNQILPGPTTVNLTVFFGMRLRGPQGALLAWLSLLGPPSLAAIAIYVVYLHIAATGLLQSVVEGVAAAALGLNAATGIETVKRHRDWKTLMVAGTVFVAVVVFHVAIPWVVLAVAPVSLALFWLDQE